MVMPFVSPVFLVWASSITAWLLGGASQSTEACGPERRSRMPFPMINPINKCNCRHITDSQLSKLNQNDGDPKKPESLEAMQNREIVETMATPTFSPTNRRRRARRKSSGTPMKDFLARNETKSTEEEIGKEKVPSKLERTDLPPSRDTPSAVTPPNSSPFMPKKEIDSSDKQ